MAISLNNLIMWMTKCVRVDDHLCVVLKGTKKLRDISLAINI